jgi:hypothetical protein
MATKKAAKKKSVKKAARKASNHAPTLPSGYKVIGRAPNWDAEKDPVIEGERGPLREVTFDEGTKKERTLNVMIVQDDTLGAVTVWESAGLKDLFEQTEDGDTVRIEYLGTAKSAKKGHNPMRLYSCGVKG